MDPLSTAESLHADLRALAMLDVPSALVGRLQRATTALLQRPMHEALVDAATRGHAGRAIKLLEMGAPPNCTWHVDNTSPLVAAIMSRNADAAVALINHGADPHALSGGMLPLRAAVKNDMFSVVKALLNSGADVNATSGEAMCTALYCAVGSRVSARMIKLLLRRGALVDRGKYGPSPHPVVSPLCRAARDKNMVAAKLLIENGAVAAAGFVDEVMYWACRNQMAPLIEALLFRGVSATSLIAGRTTALAAAVRSFTGNTRKEWAERVGVLFAADSWKLLSRARFQDFKSAAAHAFGGHEHLASAIVSRGEMEAYNGGNGIDVAARHGGVCARIALDVFARRARTGVLHLHQGGGYGRAVGKMTPVTAGDDYVNFVIAVVSGNERWSPQAHRRWAKYSPQHHAGVMSFLTALRRRAVNLPAIPDEIVIEILRQVPFGAIGKVPARGELLVL